MQITRKQHQQQQQEQEPDKTILVLKMMRMRMRMRTRTSARTNRKEFSTKAPSTMHPAPGCVCKCVCVCVKSLIKIFVTVSAPWNCSVASIGHTGGADRRLVLVQVRLTMGMPWQSSIGIVPSGNRLQIFIDTCVKFVILLNLLFLTHKCISWMLFYQAKPIDEHSFKMRPDFFTELVPFFIYLQFGNLN